MCIHEQSHERTRSLLKHDQAQTAVPLEEGFTFTFVLHALQLVHV